MQFRLAVAALGAIALFVSQAPAEETAQEIFERALKARSERPEALDKQRVQVITMEGKINDPNNMRWNDSFREIKMEGTMRFRLDYSMDIPNEGKKGLTISLLGTTGWQRATGQPPVDMDFTRADEVKTEFYGYGLSTLIPLRDKGFTLTRAPDDTVGNEAVYAIKASFRLRPDVYLNFSKKNAQLLRIVYKGKEQGIDLRKEHIFSDYKEFDGLKLPTKLVDMRQAQGQDNFKAAEWTMKDYKFPAKLGEEAFAKPEKK